MNRTAYRTAPVLAVCALALAACDGVNRFTGPATADPDVPEIVEVVVPELIRPSDVLEVEIVAAGTEGITAVDVTLIEDIVRERTLTIDPPDPDLTAFTEFQIPETLAEEAVVVRVEVEDRLGSRSDPVEVQIPVIRDDTTS